MHRFKSHTSQADSSDRQMATVAAASDSSLEDWLPITASRNAKWWYSAFHNVTAIVGAGVLSFPIAMKYLHWGGGATVLGLSWVITLFTMWQLVEMHESTEEVVDERGWVVSVKRRRFDRYHELAQEAFGQRLGLWIVIPQQLVIEVGVDIVYMVTGGQSLMKFACLVTRTDHCGAERSCWNDLDRTYHDCFPHGLNQRHWILIFASVHFLLAQLPSFNSLAFVSFVAAAMSLSYSTIAWIAAIVYLKTQGSHDESPAPSHSSSKDCYPEYAGVLNALGQIAFAYAAHNVALEIQATIPSTPGRPSKQPMMQGVLLAYFVVAICYFPVAFVGYHALGHDASENVLIFLESPRWLIAMANFMVVIHMVGSYQLYAMPVFDMMETVLVKVLHFQPTLQLRLIVRSIYVAFTCAVAIAIPFFQALLGLFGGFAFTPLTYIIPCIIWMKIRKQKFLSFFGIINCVCIVLGVLLMVASTVGAFVLLINNVDTYKLASPYLPNSTCK